MAAVATFFWGWLLASALLGLAMPAQTVQVLMGIVVLGKALVTMLIVRMFKRPVRSALVLSSSLAQIGEFSFILIVMGVSLDILPVAARDYIVAGALVAEASMRALSIDTVDICPWALREGIILRRLDSEADGTALVETSVGDAGSKESGRSNGGRSRGTR